MKKSIPETNYRIIEGSENMDTESWRTKTMKDKHFTSRMLTCAGTLMSISGILIAISVKLTYGGIMFASAACMFFGARNFRIAED